MVEDTELTYIILLIILMISSMFNLIFLVELKNRAHQLSSLGRRLTSSQQHHLGNSIRTRLNDAERRDDRLLVSAGQAFRVTVTPES